MRQRELSKDLIYLEDKKNFWNWGRKDILIKMVEKQPVLDVGCGAGALTVPLVEEGFDVYSLDIDPKCCAHTRKINRNTVCADFSKIRRGSFPLVGTVIMADVLEHIGDDEIMIKKAWEVLEPGGELIISVPYHQLFWSKNDEARGHFRRYSKKMVKKLLNENGFEIVKTRFWNFLALPIIIFTKMLKQRVPHEKITGSWLNKLLLFYIKIENKVPLFIGSSLVVKAKKKILKL